MIIRKEDQQTLLHLFSSLNKPFEIWAYGSRVNGTAHDGSDLDLVIRSTDLKSIPNNDYQFLIQKIKESNIPILVELRDWAKLPDSFHKNIEKNHELLFKS